MANPYTPTPGAAASGEMPASTQPASIRLATTRLEQSRNRLRQAMMPPPPTRLGVAERSRLLGSLPDRIGALLRRVRQSMGSWPWFDLAAETVQSWWHRYPWRPVGELVVDELGAQLRPVVRRQPIAAALVAAAAGALVVAARPWRWPLLRWPARRLPRHAAHWIGRQVAKPALQTAVLGMLVQALRPGTGADAAAANSTRTRAASGRQ